MPIPTVAGHAGKFVGGKVGDVNVYCMAGRLHRYEGIPPSMITFSVRFVLVLVLGWFGLGFGFVFVLFG